MTDDDKRRIARQAAQELADEGESPDVADENYYLPAWLFNGSMPDSVAGWLVRFTERYAFKVRCAQKKEERDQEMRMDSQ